MKTFFTTLLFILYLQNLSGQSNFISGIQPVTIPPFQSSKTSFICDTIFSFPTVDTWPTGLVSVGNYLWSFGHNLNYIYKYSFTGIVIDSILNPASFSIALAGGDLDFDGTNLLVLVEEVDSLYKINPNTGTVVNRYRVAPCTGNCHGVAFDGTHIWVCNYIPPFVYKLDAATGTLLNTFPISGSGVMLPIKFINGKLYGLTLSPEVIQEIDTTSGNIISATPWCLGYPLGFCTANNHLWGLSSDVTIGGTQRIYQFDSLLIDAVPHISADNSPGIFPNPSEGKFTISFPGIINGSIEIKNILGETVHTEKIYNKAKTEITLADVSTGIYFARINDGNRSNCCKLIIEK